MRQVATALLAFVIAASLLSAFGESRERANQNVRQSAMVVTADTFYSNALTTIIANIVAQVTAAPTTPIRAIPGVSDESGDSATTSVNGDTTAAGSNATAANLNRTIDARRLAITVTVTPGTHQAPITHRVTIAVQDSLTGYTANVLTDTVIDSSSTASTIVSADTAGCAGTGIGCDPDGVQAADSSLTTSATQCVPGYGSGVCPTPSAIPNSSYTNSSWTNNQ